MCVGASKLAETKRTQTFPSLSNYRISYMWSCLYYQPLTVLLKKVQPWMSADLHSWKDKRWTCMRQKHRNHVGLHIKITLFPRNTIGYRWEWSHSKDSEGKVLQSRLEHTVFLKAETSLDVLTGKSRSIGVCALTSQSTSHFELGGVLTVPLCYKWLNVNPVSYLVTSNTNIYSEILVGSDLYSCVIRATRGIVVVESIGYASLEQTQIFLLIMSQCIKAWAAFNKKRKPYWNFKYLNFP